MEFSEQEGADSGQDIDSTGKMGIRILSKKDGVALAKHELESPTVFNGVAVARGRVVLTLNNGHVLSPAP